MLVNNVQNKANLIELTYRNKNLMHISDTLKKVDPDFQNRNFTENNLIESGFRSLDKINYFPSLIFFILSESI